MFTRRGADVSIRGMVEGIVDARASTRSFEHGGRGKKLRLFSLPNTTVRVNLIGDLGEIREAHVRVQIHACSIRRTLTR